MKEFKIFYSWQSDLENQTNRSLIEECIEKAISSLNKDSILFNFFIDSAIRGEAGAVDIANSVFKKIKEADIVIGDITIINKDSNQRKTPNPNVLIELGYAAGVLGWSQIICVANLEHGAIEELPFDIRHRKIVSYKCYKDESKANIKKLLTSRLIFEIQQYIQVLNPSCYSKLELERLRYELFKRIKSKLPFELVYKISELDFSENFIEDIGEARKMRGFIDTVEDPEIQYLGGSLLKPYLNLIDIAIFLSGNSKLNSIFSEEDKNRAKQKIEELKIEYGEKAKELKSIYNDFIEAGNKLITK